MKGVLARLAMAMLAGLALVPACHAAPVPDTLEQRTLACAACHGQQGRATNQGYFPRIAGKPAGYLLNQLRNFRDGRRSNAAMSLLVEHLSDAYLAEIAGYFSALDLPYPPPAAAAAPAQHSEAKRWCARAIRRGASPPAPPATVQR